MTRTDFVHMQERLGGRACAKAWPDLTGWFFCVKCTCPQLLASRPPHVDPVFLISAKCLKFVSPLLPFKVPCCCPWAVLAIMAVTRSLATRRFRTEECLH